MNLKFSVICIFFTLLCILTCNRTAIPQNTLFDKVVLITYKSGNNRATGIVLKAHENEMLILTANHVVKDFENNSCLIKFYKNPTEYEAFSIDNWRDNRNDLAVIKVNSKSFPYVCPFELYSDSKINLQQKIIAIGHCTGGAEEEWMLSEGTIRKVKASTITFACDVCSGGFSGGPLLDARSEELLRLIVEYSEKLNLCYAISSPVIATIIKSLGIDTFDTAVDQSLQVSSRLDKWFNNVKSKTPPSPNHPSLEYLCDPGST